MLRAAQGHSVSYLALDVIELGKRYTIGERQRYRTLRDSLSQIGRAPFRQLKSALERQANGGESKAPAGFWALRDVSFHAFAGEVIGVVGRNGAGKSTLLKILSRITEPTYGRVLVSGRLGSLLEVGTGFHPELTGRENIFLNGAILGMSRLELGRKFDEIVEFADIEQFLDTPVKRYSSGMYMRLAFSVAAHLQPDVLVVDEVLAVGDAAFQRKCLGKMEDISREGRTVLFVSHQLGAIRRLCSKCLWLDAGRVMGFGATGKVLSDYETALLSTQDLGEAQESAHSGSVRLTRWSLRGEGAELGSEVSGFGPVTLVVGLRANRQISHGVNGIALRDPDNRVIWAFAANDILLGPGDYELRYSLPFLPLRPGVYSLEASLYADQELLDYRQFGQPLSVTTAPLGHPNDEWAGVLNIPCEFAVVEF